MKPLTITSQIETKAFELIKKSPDGIRWVDLNREIQEANPNFHPKTINGTVWKLTQKYPDKIYKSEKGVFKLISPEALDRKSETDK